MTTPEGDGLGSDLDTGSIEMARAVHDHGTFAPGHRAGRRRETAQDAELDEMESLLES